MNQRRNRPLTPAMVPHTSPISLPGPLQRWIETAAQSQLRAAGAARIDFAAPLGEPALVAADSVSWQVFRNPVSLLVGGIAAVILELAEPRVRAGVWEHTSFRRDPVGRMVRTGLAAMVTVYGARSRAEAMIAGVRRVHDKVQGETASGIPYRAADPELLCWVQATAAFGFVQAYERFVRPLRPADRDRYYAEGEPASRLYGAFGAPTTEQQLEGLFGRTYGSLERSDTIFQFLDVLNRAELLPRPLRPVQRMLVRAAVDISPPRVRSILGLGPQYGLKRWEAALVRLFGTTADRIVVESSPPVQACRRLGLPPDYLFCSSAVLAR